MELSSSSYDQGQEIPDKYRNDEGEHADTSEGRNVSPAYTFHDVPKAAKSLAIVMRDIDTPNHEFVLWLVYNIDPKRTEIEENDEIKGARTGLNTFKVREYTGPNPAQGENKIVTTLYALDSVLYLDDDADYTTFKEVIEGHILSKANYVGYCKRTGEFALE